MSEEKKFCTKCGAPLAQGATFCSRCGTSVSFMAAQPLGAQPPGAPAPPAPPRHGEKGEKQEKGEKREKEEKHEKGRGGELAGPLIGGGILVWLGFLVYLQQARFITGAYFGGYFLIGIGALLMLGGLVRRTRAGYPLTGFIIGGIVLVLLGMAALPSVRDLLTPSGVDLVGPLVLVFLGIVIIAAGISARRRSPPP